MDNELFTTVGETVSIALASVVALILPIPCEKPDLFVVTDIETVVEDGKPVTESSPDEFILNDPDGAFPVVIFADQL
jgi:hypothetical protein